MANYKKQHYVPQLYLRNFSKDGKTIGCCYCDPENQQFHLTEEAPIRTQACKDYFYSKDSRLEAEFSKIEGEVNVVIQKILASKNSVLNNNEEDLLKEFLLFQHIRTPFRANDFEAMINQAYHQIVPEDKEADIQLKGKQLFILQTLLPRAYDIVQPFKLIILDNQTEIPFVTSPEPAILFNPYQIKRKQYVYGTETHGSMFYLPLSSQKAVIMYDPLAYKIKGGKTVSCSLSDTACLNVLILDFVGKSKTNLFFFDNTRPDIQQTFSLTLQHAKEGIELSFIKERFYLFGLPKRRSSLYDEESLRNAHMSIDEFNEFIRNNRK